MVCSYIVIQKGVNLSGDVHSYESECLYTVVILLIIIIGYYTGIDTV